MTAIPHMRETGDLARHDDAIRRRAEADLAEKLLKAMFPQVFRARPAVVRLGDAGTLGFVAQVELRLVGAVLDRVVGDELLARLVKVLDVRAALLCDDSS
jgi:hypothetical protein